MSSHAHRTSEPTDPCMIQLGDSASGGGASGSTASGAHPRDAAGNPIPAWNPPASADAIIVGTPASPGMVIAPVLNMRAEIFAVEDAPGSAEEERGRFTQVLADAHAELQLLSEDSCTCASQVHSDIFRAHQALLSDPELIAEVNVLIDEGHAAPWSWQQAINRRVEEIKNAQNEHLAARATDLFDIGQRVLRLLAGVANREPLSPSGPCVLVADDLTPSDTARLDPEKVIGLCTASGGPTSHTAILARARGMPAVTGAGDAVLDLADGEMLILDGDGGRIYPHPNDATLAEAKRFQADLARRQAVAEKERFEPAVLTDGHRVYVGANVGEVREVAAAVAAGAEGVGLMRSEFLFLCRDTEPTEEEQFQAYAEMARALDGRPFVIRTCDIGGDKTVPYLRLEREDNPFLGVRGIRASLRHPSVFKTQLRAIYRAAAITAPGSVKIMFPMIATLEDLRAAKAIAEEARAELGAPRCDLGMMVEVPSAAILAREFVREADFFSIGTNDLTQYALAIDREHPELGKEADSLHPAVLRLIDQTVRAAAAENKCVGVCGGVAGEPLGTMILAGLGVAGLSVSIPSLAGVKARLRGESMEVLRELAGRALACATAAEVRALAVNL